MGSIILENAVGHEKDVQEIGVHRKFLKFVVTLLVMRTFKNFLGAPRACADFRDPTAFSRIIRLVVLLALGLVLVACGSGGGSGSDRNQNQIQESPEPTPDPNDTVEKPEVLAGVFFDSRVEGLHYVTPTQSGLTNGKGAFNYRADESIKFYIGPVFIGETLAKPVITPLDLFGGDVLHTDPQVINLVRLLVSLDTDSKPENNLTLPVTVNQLPQDLQIDFDQTVDSFAQDETVLEILAQTESGAKLATKQKSFNHFEATLVGLGIIDSLQPVLTIDAVSRALVGETVTMTMTVANISDPSAYTFLWRQISGLEVSLDTTTGLTTQFTAPAPTDKEHVVVEFLITDFLGRSWSKSATVKINTPINAQPRSWAGDDQEVLEGQIVELEGSGSDSDGTIIRVGWDQTKGEPVSVLTSTWSNSFRAPEVDKDSELKFRFSVWDNEGAVDGDGVTIRVINAPHSVDIVVDPETVNLESGMILSNALVNLKANLNIEPTDIASITWRQLKGPMVTIFGVNKFGAHFISPIVTLNTELIFELTVVNVNAIPVSATVSFVVISTLFVEALPGGAANIDFQDSDGDGVLNHIDRDDDNDGVNDVVDAFPYDPIQSIDSDADGIGDRYDIFPEDPLEWEDFDNDGIGNNSDSDGDGDGMADVDELSLGLDPLNSDTDGDGLNDSSDRFPNDSNNAEVAVEIPGQALNFEASEMLLDNDRNALLMIDQAAKRVVVVNKATQLTERSYSFDWTPQSMVLDSQRSILYVALQGSQASEIDDVITTSNSSHFGLLRHGRIARIDLNSSQKFSEIWLPIDPYRMVLSSIGLLLVAGSDGFDSRLLIFKSLLKDISDTDLLANTSIDFDSDVRMAFNINQTRIVIANRNYPFSFFFGLGNYASYWPSQPVGFLRDGGIVTRNGFHVEQGVEAGLFTQISLTEDNVLDAVLDVDNDLFFQLVSKSDEDGNPVYAVLKHDMKNYMLIEETILDQSANLLVVDDDSRIFLLSTSAQQSTLLVFGDSSSTTSQ